MKKILFILLLAPTISFSQPYSCVVQNFMNKWAVWDIVARPPGGGVSYTQLNKVVDVDAQSGGVSVIRTTALLTSGKWYCELRREVGCTGDVLIGVAEAGYPTTQVLGSNSSGWSYRSDGRKLHSPTNVSIGSAFAIGDIVGLAIDKVNNFMYVSINNVWQNGGVPTSGATGTGNIWSGFTNPVWITMSSSTTFNASLKIFSRPQELTYTAPAGYNSGAKN